MPEYILITDPDGTNRTVQKTQRNVNFIARLNEVEVEAKRLKIGKTFASEQEANDYIAENKVTIGHSPVAAVGTLKNVVKEQQSEIDALKAQIQKMAQAQAPSATAQAEQPNVVKTLEKLKALTTVEEIEQMLVGEERSTIINEGKKLIKKLSE
jgi:hypothetical protein